MVSALDFGSSDPGSSPGRGHCVVVLGKTLYSRSASLHPANLMLGVTLRWTSIPSRESRNTPSCFMLQKPGGSSIGTEPIPLGIFAYLLDKLLTNQFPRLNGKQPRTMNYCQLCYFKIPQILFLSTGDLGASAILGSLDFKKYLGKLISYLDPVVPDAFRSEFVRCWHAKTEGSAASTFHDNCDGKGPTVTIIKSGSYIFGGYTDLSWQSKYS